jgi:hypothetical protein
MRLGRVIDGQLERLLMRCLAKRPDKRPQTAKELAAELLACQVGKPWTTALAEEWWLGHPAGNASAKSPPDTAEPSTYRNDGETLIRDVI